MKLGAISYQSVLSSKQTETIMSQQTQCSKLSKATLPSQGRPTCSQCSCMRKPTTVPTNGNTGYPTPRAGTAYMQSDISCACDDRPGDIIPSLPVSAASVVIWNANPQPTRPRGVICALSPLEYRTTSSCRVYYLSILHMTTLMCSTVLCDDVWKATWWCRAASLPISNSVCISELDQGDSWPPLPTSRDAGYSLRPQYLRHIIFSLLHKGSVFKMAYRIAFSRRI